MIEVLKNNVGRSFSLNTSNGQHECGYIMPFTIGDGYEWLRFINVSSTVIPCYRGNFFDIVDIGSTIITDINVTIKEVVYEITYIRIADITRFKILE
jgi:hypothetical protein